MWGNRHIVPQRRYAPTVELTRATNPYSAGAGTMPPFLAGRDADVELREGDVVVVKESFF